MLWSCGTEYIIYYMGYILHYVINTSLYLCAMFSFNWNKCIICVIFMIMVHWFFFITYHVGISISFFFIFDGFYGLILWFYRHNVFFLNSLSKYFSRSANYTEDKILKTGKLTRINNVLFYFNCEFYIILIVSIIFWFLYFWCFTVFSAIYFNVLQFNCLFNFYFYCNSLFCFCLFNLVFFSSSMHFFSCFFIYFFTYFM